MTDDKKPREFAIPSHSTSSEYQELYQAYEALADENKKLREAIDDLCCQCWGSGCSCGVKEAKDALKKGGGI